MKHCFPADKYRSELIKGLLVKLFPFLLNKIGALGYSNDGFRITKLHTEALCAKHPTLVNNKGGTP